MGNIWKNSTSINVQLCIKLINFSTGISVHAFMQELNKEERL